jgi:hypothetical protein
MQHTKSKSGFNSLVLVLMQNQQAARHAKKKDERNWQ